MIKKTAFLLAQVLLWLVVAAGSLAVSAALAQLYMLSTGSQPGTPIFLDTLAPTWTDAFLDLAYGLLLVGAPFALRFAIRRWLPVLLPSGP